MKKELFIFALLFSLGVNLSISQTSFMVDDDIAVFYPANFDSTQTLPSLALVKDLLPAKSVAADWKITPSFQIENGKAVAKITYQGQVDLYGNGEVTGALRRNDTKITLWNTDNYAYGKDDGKRLYQSHPWVMGVREDGTCFGIIADNSWKQYFDLSNPITITSDGPAFRVIVIEKKNPEELLKALAEVTGTMKLPPLWALGYQQCRFSYYPATRVKEIADEFRNRKIPCDVIWMDIDYMDGFRIFTFNSQGFPDPKGLNDYLHNKNFKSVYMIDPGVKKDAAYWVYNQGTAGNHWVFNKSNIEYNGNVWPGLCAFPDFTRPETQTWWGGLYADFMSKGVDGVWNDMNEPSVFDGPDGTMPEDNIHRGGGELPQGIHLRYHNVYGYLMVRSTREGILQANPTKRPFVLSRDNFLGGQRYAATWTGDNVSSWDFLKMSIPMSLNLSLSGQPFNGADIGGFVGDATGDLLGHWMALGVYYPFSRNHSSSGTVNQEPWAFGDEIENVSRTAINRRYRLLPYLYTKFREASETGIPIMQPQFFADLKDLNLRKEQQSFLLGGDLMIIPRWAENVKVPSANWNPLKVEKEDDGYQAIVLIRPGAIVPLGSVIQSTVEYKSDSVTLLLNPTDDGVALGTLYHDAGNGFEYESGDYVLQQFVSSKYHTDSLKIDITKIEGTKTVNRTYRIGYVTDDSIAYNNWSTDTVQYVKIIPDLKPYINLALLNKVYAGGTFNSWAALTLSKSTPTGHTWISDPVKIAAGTQELKFSYQSDWTGSSWGNATGLTGTAQVITPTGKNVIFTAPVSGNYIISFNDSTLSYSIVKSMDSKQTQMYVAGTFNSWNLSENKMTLKDNYLWRLSPMSMTVGNYELKFANTSNWSGDDWGNASGLSGTAQLTTGGYPNIAFTIPETKSYSICFNDSTLEYSIVDAASETDTAKISKVELFPNPVTSKLNIRSSKAIGKVEIFDAVGVSVLIKQIAEKESVIDVSSLNTGLYVIKIKNENNELYKQKIVINK